MAAEAGAAVAIAEDTGQPYIYNESISIPQEVISLWVEVGNGLDKNQTVVWKNAVESLDHAMKYLRTSPRARTFAETYMTPIIGILVEQQPAKIGNHERGCVEDSLLLAVRIVADDLAIQVQRQGTSKLLPTLVHVFNKKKAFYKSNKGGWNVNHHHAQGVPEARLRNIERFRMEKGFRHLHDYFQQKVESRTSFPPLQWIHDVLYAAYDSMLASETSDPGREMEEDAMLISKVVMAYVKGCPEEELKKMPPEELKIIQTDLQRIYDHLVANRRQSTYEFYEFWRDLVLRLIRSQSLPLKLFGWEQVADLIRACESHRPPPRGFVVANAGTSFTNGFYAFGGAVTVDGYARQGTEFSYIREIPAGNPDGGGKKLTLFRCTMRSQQKWWFLSEADEEQPGTDRDIDYYQHKAKEHEDAYPPEKGWITCRNSGTDPPPTMEGQGLVVPDGSDFDTLEHQLAKWAIENDIVEQVLGDTTIHREVVSRSTVLIKFLASMCTRVSEEGSQYCLQASHLLFAWKTCTRKADAAVSLQVYQLLVSILPLCPNTLAIPLLQAVQTSLHEGAEKQGFLFEVSEFCSALADGIVVDAKSTSTSTLSDDVREEALNLLWSVLTHPEAASLKSYESLKQYVTQELRVEPKGSEHRERFLQSCVTVLTRNARMKTESVNEVQSLRMVKLFNFVFAACPKPQAEKIASRDDGRLPSLLFLETTSYLDRRELESCQALGEVWHRNALKERLRTLRHIYGLAIDPLGPDSLRVLWDRCCTPSDRESVMVFIADASQNGKSATLGPDNILSTAISDETCKTVFLDLFCSTEFDYRLLGENGYSSFRQLFNHLRVSFVPSPAKRSALDALWRICLTVTKDSVADAAMTDLLLVYISLQNPQVPLNGVGNGLDTMAIDEIDESFENRIYDYLNKLRDDLVKNPSLAELSIQRSLRILKSAIGETSQDPLATLSTIGRLVRLPTEGNFDDAMRCLPHRMRGQACYRRIGVITKGSSQRGPAITKFSLNVHSLETLASLKRKVAAACQFPLPSIKLVQINGRGAGAGLQNSSGESSHLSLSSASEDCTVDEIGIVQGCEAVFVAAERPNQVANAVVPQSSRAVIPNNLSSLFFGRNNFSRRLHSMLLAILQALPRSATSGQTASKSIPTQKLSWDLLLAMPTDETVQEKVKNVHYGVQGVSGSSPDAMEVDSSPDTWSGLLDFTNFDASVYALMTIDASLQPAPEALSLLSESHRQMCKQRMLDDANLFRRSFIDGGGFSAVVQFFSAAGAASTKQSQTRRGNAVALRVLKSCLFGTDRNLTQVAVDSGVKVADDTGLKLLQSLSAVDGLLRSLTVMVVDDDGISSSTISDVLRLLALLFQSPKAAQTFVSLPGAEKFLIALLLWSGGPTSAMTSSSVSAASQVRRTSHDLILQVPTLADYVLPCLIRAVGDIDPSLECTNDFFDVLENLITDDKKATALSTTVSVNELHSLAITVCKKIASCPKPPGEAAAMEQPTAVLCGCLKLLRALVEKGGGAICDEGVVILLSNQENRWSTALGVQQHGMMAMVTSKLSASTSDDDATLIDLMGAIFDGFLSPNAFTGVAICCDKESRRRGFEVISACARSCRSNSGYQAIVSRVSQLVEKAAPKLRHRWGQFGQGGESRTRGRGSSQYLGLRNQGCTCYMNSVLQQLFMMPEIQDSMLSAPLPAKLRLSNGAVSDAGDNLVGKKISLQWESGVSYDANVESYDAHTTMHTVRYLPIQVATVGGTNHPPVQPEEISRIPPFLPDEFVLSEGRPGKETGAFELVVDAVVSDVNGMLTEAVVEESISENDEEATSRQLLEEVQRTFIHLKEGSKGRCFDPRVLVEACACLKLEFDVWQQNDASEFATKLLDRLEPALKKWAPDHFAYMDHTFGIKVTKQKICKECGLVTNREEKLLNIDCQIRGKSDINEALEAMTEVEIMEGSNKVHCERCDRNTDTVLRTALSTLPNMLLLSLKRFDLDFTTFETIKLNSRCAFGQTLNLKRYTLEGLEAAEKAVNNALSDPAPMDTGDSDEKSELDSKPLLPDEDYDYRLAGVLVHAGVAQGGHYYSFIKDRSDATKDKWYRFDDEDVTPFDPALIEAECFGGKVKKETKWPNGQVQTVEQEQFANALMLFYEKVKPTKVLEEKELSSKPSEKEKTDSKPIEPSPDFSSIKMSTGYDAYGPDVRTSNAAHRWQSFLFDSELQAFLKGLLGLCQMKLSEKNLKLAEYDWLPQMMDILITYVFDALLYSSELSSMNDWMLMLEAILASNHSIAVPFIRKLARKTKAVSSNWLRTFLLECPEKRIRAAAVRVFSAAAVSAVFEEHKPLQEWAVAWKEQVAELENSRNVIPNVMPCMLEGRWSSHEDIAGLETGRSSSLGMILSYVNELLDAIPRNWRFATESCVFVRNLAKMRLDGRLFMRPSLVFSLISARLAALLARERSPPVVKAAFPAATMSQEVANIQAKAESNPTSHIGAVGSTSVMSANEMNSQRGPTTGDYLAILEALLCIGGLSCAIQAPLIHNPDEMGRSRQRFLLSERATKALKIVFQESCPTDSTVMPKRDLEAFLTRTDTNPGGPIPPEKIHEIITKYQGTGEGGGNRGGACLTLEGFLAYYRDCVQSNDSKLKLDLHTFGFRPDLSRRSKEARTIKHRERDTMREAFESVAIDVAEMFGDKFFDVGRTANMVLLTTGQIFASTFSVSEPLMEYLVAATVYRKDAEPLILSTLKTLYQSPNDWAGKERVSSAVKVLQTIASTPGENQQSNISKIMLSPVKPGRTVNFGGGLLEVTKALEGMTRSGYNNDVYLHLARYTSILRDMYKLLPVYQWMAKNRSVWAFIERDLLNQRGHPSNDFGQQDIDHAVPIDQHVHSDSDMAGMNDSEDDEDSQYDNVEGHVSPIANDGPSQISIHGAGNSAVNGLYCQDGFFANACRYVKLGRWNNTDHRFYIFQCHVSNNTRHWYISIVPYGGNPGTSSDIDFYTAPMNEDVRVPPKTGWVKSNEGRDPPPRLEFRYETDSESGLVTMDGPNPDGGNEHTYV